MKSSSTTAFRRLAVGSTVLGALALLSAVGNATTFAYDSASHAAYADGWQAGDNGGTGFTAWNFDTDSFVTSPGIQGIDDGLKTGGASSSPFNAIGKAWRIALPDTNGLPRAGRGFAPLQIGQTLMVTIDNPTQRQFFRGYFVRLNGGTGGVKGNLCYGGASCSPGGGYPSPKMTFQTFEYFSNGEWSIVDSSNVATDVLDTDTSAAGARFWVTRTGAETYDVAITSLGGAPMFTASRTFANAGTPLDWIEFTFFNTVTDVSQPTDFYIRSMQITNLPEPGTLAALCCAAGILGVLIHWRSRS